MKKLVLKCAALAGAGAALAGGYRLYQTLAVGEKKVRKRFKSKPDKEYLNDNPDDSDSHGCCSESLEGLLDCPGGFDEMISCPDCVETEERYLVKIPDSPEIVDPRCKHYEVRIKDVKVAFKYIPGFERSFPDEFIYCEEREAVFTNDDGDVIRVEVLDGDEVLFEEDSKKFMETMGKYKIPVSVRDICDEDYRAFAYWSGPDPEMNNYTTGCNIRDRHGLVILSCVGESMPRMFKDVEISRIRGKCRVS